MKKFIFTLILVMVGSFTFAQSNFDKKISEKALQLKTAKTSNDFQNLYNEFSKLTVENDPNRWKAYYYAGLAKYQEAELSIKSGYSGGADEINAIAYKFAMAASSAKKDNADVKNLLTLIDLQSKKLNNNNFVAH